MQKRYTWRLYFVVAILIVMAAMLVYRLSFLTISNKAFLQNKSHARTTRIIALPVSRGAIYDRNGVVLAASTASKSLWIDPSEADVPQIVDWYMQGKIDIDPMITHTLALEDINKGFDLMHAGESIRSVVVF